MLWRKVIVGKLIGGWCSRVGREGYSVGLWKKIRKGWGVLKATMRFEVGNGRRIKFWEDVWSYDVPLKTLFYLYLFY